MARWIKSETKKGELEALLHRFKYTCSCCGQDQGYGPTPYCMWCGAKMDEKEEKK